ncbi:hypothetical protein ABB25_01000 [Stenotrophomonas koreensis]|uniref:Uncharacterized protein n=1 Tax=Stenotrophomonas koreensis TaxID=266128 RepID=A0A0R0C323_9GAMM|nr:hypothetical protein [Stenotrophomonas koreensis]KRG60802.1 hypothetical protein ABB25_01000 [Stenotrophomonas koreensis]
MIDPSQTPPGLIGWIAGAAAAIGAWFHGRGGRRRDEQATTTESRLYETVRLELDRLTEQVRALERRSGRMLNHIYRLEGLMRSSGIEPPPFDPDVSNPGGTD